MFTASQVLSMSQQNGSYVGTCDVHVGFSKEAASLQINVPKNSSHHIIFAPLENCGLANGLWTLSYAIAGKYNVTFQDSPFSTDSIQITSP